MVTADNRRSLFPQKYADADAEWRAFYQAFPDAAGMINVSLPGYSHDGAEALVYLEWQGGSLAAEGFVLRLACRQGMWHVKERLSQWVS